MHKRVRFQTSSISELAIAIPINRSS